MCELIRGADDLCGGEGGRKHAPEPPCGWIYVVNPVAPKGRNGEVRAHDAVEEGYHYEEKREDLVV